MKKASLFFAGIFFQTIVFCQMNRKADSVLQMIQSVMAQEKGVFALAFKNLESGETVLWNEKENFHAASTMKTPVMIEAYKQAAAGKFSLNDLMVIKNEFKSIVDSSLYSLNAADDSYPDIYQQIGTKASIHDLVYQMIINSSNLATNLMMEKLGGKNITESMRELGAKDIRILRGVEDGKAFAQNLNNTVTAYDLMLIYEQMALGKIIGQKESEAMISILLDQRHNTLIPALLPKELRIAHKTGTITGVHHDSGIVFLPDGRKYVLVILSKQLEDADKATAAMAKLSLLLYKQFFSL
ncbi:MAG: hypothetical protein RLZZ28_1734 [Bacteroidota bacterium]|jgi:beta-lactamase class A